jgi:DNA-binding NarL/FixJ family response regulator
MENKIKIGVVDDQQLFRKGLISLLNEFEDLEVVLEAENGKDLLNKLSNKAQPNVLLLDIEMPIMNGIEVLQKLREKKSQIKVIIITMHDEEEMVLHLIEKGANGFLPKSEDIENVVQAVKSVIETGYYFNDKFSNAMLFKIMNEKDIQPKFITANLGDKEIEIIQLICKEYTNKEIAAMLFLSVRTIDGYRERILRKIGARNTAGIVLYAIKNKLI